MRHGVGIVDHIEDRVVGLKVRDIYEVPAAAIILTAHTELERLRHHPPEPVQAPMDQSGPTWSTPASGGSRCGRHRGLLDPVNGHVTGKIGMKLYKGSPASSPASRPTRSTTHSSRRSTVRRAVQPAGIARIHRTLDAAGALAYRVAQRG